jgi:peptide/nickel transport system substrate-binding protein
MRRNSINQIRRLGVVMLIGIAAFVASGGTRGVSAPVAESQGSFTLIPATNQPTFGRNYNIAATGTYAATSSTAPGTNFMYEPLVGLNSQKGVNTPLLARSWKWSNGGKTLTMQLRRNAKWSDGVPFTSADVKYSYATMPRKYPKLPIVVPTFATLRAPTPYTVVFTFREPAVTEFGPFTWTTAYIVPKHQYEKQNLATWTNPDPVTTGPFVLEKFTPQEVTLKVRDDYWGGTSKGVRTVKIPAAATPTAAQQLMLKGQGDYYGFNWPNYQSVWVKSDPAHRKFVVNPNSQGAIEFNLDKRPFDNIHIRRAFYYAINSAQATKALNYGGVVPNITGMNYASYGEQIAPEFRKQLQHQDVSKAKAELAASGYSVVDGKLTSGGQSYPLTFTANTGNGQIVEPLFVDDWKRVLGVEVSVDYLNDQAWLTAIQKGNFQISNNSGSGGGGGGCNTYCTFSGLAGGSNFVPSGKHAATDWDRANDPVTTKLLNALKAAPTPARALQLSWAVQRRVVDQRFWIPYVNVGGSSAYSTVRWNWPSDLTTSVPKPGASNFGAVILDVTPVR